MKKCSSEQNRSYFESSYGVPLYVNKLDFINIRRVLCFTWIVKTPILKKGTKNTQKSPFRKSSITRAEKGTHEKAASSSNVTFIVKVELVFSRNYMSKMQETQVSPLLKFQFKLRSEVYTKRSWYFFQSHLQVFEQPMVRKMLLDKTSKERKILFFSYNPHPCWIDLTRQRRFETACFSDK